MGVAIAVAIKHNLLHGCGNGFESAAPENAEGECWASRTPANASTRKYWPSAAKQHAEALRRPTAQATENTL